MSGRATTPTPKYTTRTKYAKCFLFLGLLVGVGGSTVIAVNTAIAQDEIDDKPVLPPAEPKRQATLAKLRIPNRDSAVFIGSKDKHGAQIPNTGIVDFEPMASEKNNSDEYQAWTIVVQWAKQFSTTELEQHATRDLTRDDLVWRSDNQLGASAVDKASLKKAMEAATVLPRTFYRLELVRFDGKLVKIRRVPASLALKQDDTPEIYEAMVVPLGEPNEKTDIERTPAYAVSVVFTELPEALAALKQTPSGEWLAVDSWATAAGYFFKVKQDGVREEAIPVLVAKSVTLLKGVPVGTGPKATTLYKNLRVFKLIKDDTLIAKAEDNWEECSAFNRVLLHARRFTPEELESNANGELKYADLATDNRRDYQLDLVKFEGRLLMLKKAKATEKLLDAGIDTLYEGWIVPKDTPGGNPICVMFTDPPEDVEANGRVNKWVSFAGYSFKYLRYASGEHRADNPEKYKTKRAPLLLGRAMIDRPDPEVAVAVAWNTFLPTVIGSVGVMLAVAFALNWWLRKGDRQAKREIDSHRLKNPFGESGQPNVRVARPDVGEP